MESGERYTPHQPAQTLAAALASIRLKHDSLGVYVIRHHLVTAQNTQGFRDPSGSSLLHRDQKSVFDDIESAIKIGMLHSREVAERVLLQKVPVVLDPVMVATARYFAPRMPLTPFDARCFRWN